MSQTIQAIHNLQALKAQIIKTYKTSTWVTLESKQKWYIPHEHIKSIAQQTKTDTTTPESKQEWDIPHDQIKSIAQLKQIKDTSKPITKYSPLEHNRHNNQTRNQTWLEWVRRNAKESSQNSHYET